MTTPVDTVMSCEGAHCWVPLNLWNQLAPRSYNRFVLCFEVDNDEQEAALKHLQSCAVKLGRRRPVLRSLLKVDDPIAVISPAAQHDIPVEVHDVRETFGKTYSQLKETEFPASAFVNSVTELPAVDVAPALIIRIYIVDGGLLLGVHLHHSLGDGKAIDDVISWFSAETRGDMYDTTPVIPCGPFEESCCSLDTKTYASYGNSDGHLLDEEQISERFPERRLLSSSFALTPVSGLTGKIFVFKVAVLNKIQSLVQGLGRAERPSTSVVLIALLWGHIVKARTAAWEIDADMTTHSGYIDDEQVIDEAGDSRLFTIVDSRKRVFNEDRAHRYFGNAAETALARVPMADLLQACRSLSSGSDPVVAAKHLGSIIHSIQDSIQAVDRESLRERHKLYARLPDPRKLGLDYLPHDMRAFMFNSWRYIGMNAGQAWNVTGAAEDGAGRYPDAIRRAGGAWNWPAAVLLPSRPGASELEMMITVEEEAMELLLGDEEIMGLVDRVVD